MQGTISQENSEAVAFFVIEIADTQVKPVGLLFLTPVLWRKLLE